jgi:cell division protein FtsB
MGLLTEIRRRAGDAIGPVVGFCVVAYFAYHTIEGDRGVVAWLKLREQSEAARAEVQDLRAERQALERRVAAIKPGSLDLDLLDERVRAVLNHARKNETVVYERRPLAGP